MSHAVIVAGCELMGLEQLASKSSLCFHVLSAVCFHASSKSLRCHAAEPLVM